MKKTYKLRKSFRIDPEIFETLKKIAVDKDCNMTNVLEYLIKNHKKIIKK